MASSVNLFSRKGLRVHPSVRRVMERHPSLDAETETRLVLAAQSGDTQSRQKLINHNLALICKVGGAYRTEYGHAVLEDDVLLNQGVMGLDHAIDRWRPDGGARLGTYASWHILKAMQADDCLNADDAIRIPTSARISLDKVQQTIDRYHENPLTVEELAEVTELSEKRVNQLLQVHQPSSLNVEINQTELIQVVPDLSDHNDRELGTLLSTLPFDIAIAIQEKRWSDVFAQIPSAVGQIIQLKFLEDLTHQEIAERLSIPLYKIGRLLKQGLKALQDQLKPCIPSVTPAEEPIETGEPIPQLPITEVVEAGRKLLTRGLGFGVQVAQKAKRIAQKTVQALSNPLKVFTQPHSIQTEPTTTYTTTVPIGSADSTSARPSTAILSFGATHNNIVDFEQLHSRGDVSLSFYSQKVFDSGGLAMLRDFIIFSLGILFASALHVSGVVDVARWGRIINREEVSDIADDVGDVVKEKFKK